MEYLKVKELAKKWGVSERTVRNYCSSNRIEGAKLNGKTWMVPANTKKPYRSNQKKNKNYLLDALKKEKKNAIKGGIYDKLQVDFSYNSNHIEGNKLNYELCKYIYETNSIASKSEALDIDDLLEVINHFSCIDMTIENAKKPLSESFIKSLHRTFKNGSSDTRTDGFRAGEYKKFPNEVAGKETTSPKEVKIYMKSLINEYNTTKEKTLDDILDFHYRFEMIHPFADGNGRVGRLIIFKECLRNNIVPFIIYEDFKAFYYRGLDNWEKNRGYLRDTCTSAQESFKKYLDNYGINYN